VAGGEGSLGSQVEVEIVELEDGPKDCTTVPRVMPQPFNKPSGAADKDRTIVLVCGGQVSRTIEFYIAYD